MKSPGNWTIEDLFEGHADSYRLFSVVRKYIESIGPVNIRATRTRVSFSGKTKFAWIWLPQIWNEKQKEGSITLTFDLGRQIQSPEKMNQTEPRPGRWTRHVVIETESDLNLKVRQWIREAYLSAQSRKPRLDKKRDPVSEGVTPLS
jgi:hypothetical protein